MKYIKNLVLLAVISLFAACSSTKVTSSWKSPDVTYSNLPVKKIMVAALLPERNRQLQKSMERQLVGELKSKESTLFRPTKYMALNTFRRMKRKL